MRILITGAGGFIGRHLVEYLLQHTDWQITAASRSGTNFADERVTEVTRDLRFPIAPSELGDDIDLVVNLAASSDVRTFLVNPAHHVMNNVDSMLNLLQWAVWNDVKNFVHISTNEIYGPAHEFTRGHREWDTPMPPTPYSASKAAQEMLAVAWWRTYGVPVTLINTMHVFGERQPTARFIPTVTSQLIKGDDVTIYGGIGLNDTWLPALRSWTYVGDLVHAIHWILTSVDDEHHDRPPRWHVAGPELSCLEVATLISRQLDRPLNVRWLSTEGARPGYDYRYALNTTALSDAGYEPLHGFATGLRRTVDHIREEVEGK